MTLDHLHPLAIVYPIRTSSVSRYPAFEPAKRPSFMPSTPPSGLIAHHAILGCYLQNELAYRTNVAARVRTPHRGEMVDRSPRQNRDAWSRPSAPRPPVGQVCGPAPVPRAAQVVGGLRDAGWDQVRDVGPKTMRGCAAVDNGFARSEFVCGPHRRGVQQPHAKLSYGGVSHTFSNTKGVALCGDAVYSSELRLCFNTYEQVV